MTVFQKRRQTVVPTIETPFECPFVGHSIPAFRCKLRRIFIQISKPILWAHLNFMFVKRLSTFLGWFNQIGFQLICNGRQMFREPPGPASKDIFQQGTHLQRLLISNVTAHFSKVNRFTHAYNKSMKPFETISSDLILTMCLGKDNFTFVGRRGLVILQSY